MCVWMKAKGICVAWVERVFGCFTYDVMMNDTPFSFFSSLSYSLSLLLSISSHFFYILFLVSFVARVYFPVWLRRKAKTEARILGSDGIVLGYFPGLIFGRA